MPQNAENAMHIVPHMAMTHSGMQICIAREFIDLHSVCFRPSQGGLNTWFELFPFVLMLF